ncbi:MAG: hypothetical protein EB140_07215 [Proteobacteria bacterium]|nr:hypothetical protein [Pseudomonadota bacterium]
MSGLAPRAVPYCPHERGHACLPNHRTLTRCFLSRRLRQRRGMMTPAIMVTTWPNRPQLSSHRSLHRQRQMHFSPNCSNSTSNPSSSLIMREYHGLGYEEIAEILGTSRTAVKTLLLRARESFRLHYAKMHPNLAAEARGPRVLPRAMGRTANTPGTLVQELAAV